MARHRSEPGLSRGKTPRRRAGKTRAGAPGVALYRAVLEHAHQSLMVVDRLGRLVYLNAEARELLAALGAASSSPGASIYDVDAPLSGVLRPAVERAAAGRTTELQREILLGRSWRWISLHVHALGDRSRRVVITTRDITDRRRAEILQQAAEEREQRSEELYRLLALYGTDMISRLTPQAVFTYVSPSCTTLLGWAPQDLEGRSVLDLCHPDDREAVRRTFAGLGEQSAPDSVAYRILRKDGTYTWFETTCRRIGTGDDPPEIIADSRDVSSRRQLEEERDRLFTYSVDLLTVAGYDGYIKQVNPAWTQTLGWTERELLERPWIELVHPEDRGTAEAIREETRKEHSFFSLETRVRKKGAGYIWVSWNAFSVRVQQLIFAVGRDVTERKELEERLRLLADHDHLTGAYNRRTWQDLTEKEIARSRRYAFPLSVLMIDLDHFKDVNDRYGHAAGDEVLRAVPRIFATVLRGHDVVGRIGGEEFAVTLAQCDIDTAMRIADRLRVGAETTLISVLDARIQFTLSAGATALERDDDLEALMRRADAALYQAKREGRNRVVRGGPTDPA